MHARWVAAAATAVAAAVAAASVGGGKVVMKPVAQHSEQYFCKERLPGTNALPLVVGRDQNAERNRLT